MPTAPFFQPAIKGFDFLDCPAFSFLIQSSSGRSLLFDLGIRKDWQNLAPVVTDWIQEWGAKITVEKGCGRNPGRQRREAGERRGDHMEPLPLGPHRRSLHLSPTTTLIVGPGFTSSLTPGFPSNPNAPILASDYENRTVREISFDDSPLTVGRFRAVDYFNDGSLYLLDSPGHTIGHMCALARTSTSPDTFILMGGDVSHHGGQFRPTEYLPLPQELKPNPLDRRSPHPCPGSLFGAMHWKKKDDEPFLEVANLEDGKGHQSIFKEQWRVSGNW